MLTKQQCLTGLRYGIILLLVIGIVLRFSNLDKKVYWIDEVNTSIRISAYTSSEIMQVLPTGTVIGIQRITDLP